MRSRILVTASDLIAEHGVDGTSLQMIADKLGVAKAAVYYYYKTKDAIVAAACAGAFAEFYAAIDEAEEIEAARSRADALEVLIPRLVGLAVEGRRTFTRIHLDPVIVRLVAQDEQLRTLRRRFDRLVAGGEAGAEGLVRGAVVVAAIVSAVAQQSVSELDDEALILHLTRILGEVVAPTLGEH